MKPLTVVYWSKVGLGIIAALSCALLRFNSLLSGLSFGILFYILTYYILKRLFVTKVEKASELFKTGIGAYFLTWIVVYALLFTLMHPTAVFTYSPESPVVGDMIDFDAGGSYDLIGYIVSYAWDFGDGTNATGVIVDHSYVDGGTYTVTLTVTDNEGYKATLSKSLEIEEGD